MSDDAVRLRIHMDCEKMGEAAVRAELDAPSCKWAAPKRRHAEEWINLNEAARQDVQDALQARGTRANELQMYASWAGLAVAVVALIVSVIALNKS